MIKAVFFDLDGTLLTSKKTVDPSSFEAIRECRAAGIRCFIATARSSYLARMLGWADEEVALFDGGVFYNGACTIIDGHEEYVYLPEELVRECISIASEYEDLHICVQTEMPYHAFNYTLPEHLITPWGLEPDEILPFEPGLNTHTVKLLFCYDSLIDSTVPLPDEFVERIRHACGDAAHSYHSDGGCVFQMVEKSAGKYAAIERIRRALGLSADEIAVFGDDTNDIEMLSKYPNSFAMASGDERAVQSAAHVTAGCDNGGISLALKRILCENKLDFSRFV